MHPTARFMGRRRDSPARISFNLTIASAHFSTAHNVEAFHDDIKSYAIRSLPG
jgi:hypothetical protein